MVNFISSQSSGLTALVFWLLEALLRGGQLPAAAGPNRDMKKHWHSRFDEDVLVDRGRRADDVTPESPSGVEIRI